MNELSFLDSLFNDVLANTPRVMYSNTSTPRVDVKEENDSNSGSQKNNIGNKWEQMYPQQ